MSDDGDEPAPEESARGESAAPGDDEDAEAPNEPDDGSRGGDPADGHRGEHHDDGHEVESDDGGRGFLGNIKHAREQLGEAKEAFANARGAGELPRDEADRVKLVCRRHAEKRAVPLDDLGRPACFDEDHPDCRGCLEDVRDGSVETWE